MLSMLPAFGAWGQPANDDFADAQNIGEGLFEFCTEFATDEDTAGGSCKGTSPRSYSTCRNQRLSPQEGHLVLLYSDLHGQRQVLHFGDHSAAPPTLYDIKLSIYDGCTGINPLGPLVATYDACTAAMFPPVFTLKVFSGQQLMIRIGGCKGAFGQGQMLIECFDTKQNNLCSDPNQLARGQFSYAFDGTVTLEGPDLTGAAAGDLWYEYTALGDSTVTFATCGSSAPTGVGVYQKFITQLSNDGGPSDVR